MVDFFTQSTGNITTYNWSFPGGHPSTSSDPTPVISYHPAGIYDVQLIVSKGYWRDTLLQQHRMTVNPIPDPPFSTANGISLEYSVAT
ncbi:MAG: PKD domain-containing protein [Alphaproteobacteria bacterium]|nr:PKD domain-containing protein [Alphaproteobacteria bacterium]